MALIAGGFLLPVFALLAIFLHLTLGQTILFVIGGESLSVTAISWFAIRLAERAGDAAKQIYMPSGATTPYLRSFSYQQAMVMRGDVIGAIRSYEALITEEPDDVHVRLAAAELLARTPGFAERAATLYREARALPAATRRNELAATNALIDLYRGALADDGKMRTELRRLADRFAGTPPGDLARDALTRTATAPSEEKR